MKHLTEILTKKQIALVQKKGVTIRKNSNEFYSLREILVGHKARTGASGYSKGWASKSVWTSRVVALCNVLGIAVESGNDAPRGGTNGEYVIATNKKQLAGNTRIFNLQKKTEKQAKEIKEAEAAKREQEIRTEASSLILDQTFFDAVKWADEVTGKEKSARSASAMKGLLQRNRVEKITTDFWQVYRIIKNKI